MYNGLHITLLQRRLGKASVNCLTFTWQRV